MPEASAAEKFAPLVVNSQHLPQQIADRLRAQIVSGELRPGERLPSERELAGSLNVSRGALREAAGSWKRPGSSRSGTDSVRSLPKRMPRCAWPTRSRRRPPASVDRRAILELYDIRRMLEPQAAALAAERATPAQTAAMRALCERARPLLAEPAPDVATLQLLDTQLHAAVHEAAGNLVLVRVMNDLLDLLGESRRYTMRVPGRPRVSWGEHRAIVDAIARRRPAAARRAMELHLERMVAPITPVRRERKGLD